MRVPAMKSPPGARTTVDFKAFVSAIVCVLYRQALLTAAYCRPFPVF
jgi:hypothetical protein